MKTFKDLFLVASLAAVTSVSADVAVIVNKANADSFSKDAIERIYLGKTKYLPNGSEAQVVAQKIGSGTTDEFTRKALSKSANQYKVYWSKRTFSGKGIAPEALENDAEVIEFIVNNTNGIGYIDSESVTDDVKVIATF